MRRRTAITAIERLGRLDAGPLPDGFSSVEASLATLRGTIPWGDIGAGLANARRAAELEGPSRAGDPSSAAPSASASTSAAQFDEADGWLAESAELCAVAPDNGVSR